MNVQLNDITLPVGIQGHGRIRASLNINIAMRYVELEDGQAIDGDRASEIRKFACAVRMLNLPLAISEKIVLTSL